MLYLIATNKCHKAVMHTLYHSSHSARDFVQAFSFVLKFFVCAVFLRLHKGLIAEHR